MKPGVPITRFCLLLAAALTACRPAPVVHKTVQDSTVLVDARDVDALVRAYRERVRLGLGSPFRTMEIAARDERLPHETRVHLLTELFERIANGNTYDIGATLPLSHYRVISSAMHSAHDPRIAELAVNLAYEIAVEEQTVTPELQYAASSTAALMRDRALAKWDAQRVRDLAKERDQPPHELVPALRAARLLLVEQPLQPVMNAQAEAEAVRLALLLVGGVRQAQRTRAEAWPAARATELDGDVAIRILKLAAAHPRPPQAGVIIALRSAALPIAARNEEELVALVALEEMQGQATLALQRAAVALRPFAQERIWYARRRTPTAPELLARYGVQIVFDESVPRAWHGYYYFVLDETLADLLLVVPGLTLKGLTIEVGEVKDAAAHLAYHDPRRRVIRWAPSTASGSLAHEVAHDIDWQIARRSYGKSGYGSDVASDVAAMLLVTRGDTAGNERGTEVFARQFDWVAATVLAEQGRVNGHLSSVQHDWLPGHGSARPPVATARSARALSGLVARGARLDESARRRIEQGVLAASLPQSVHAVRRLRQDAQLAAGPRVASVNSNAGLAGFLAEYLQDTGPSAFQPIVAERPFRF